MVSILATAHILSLFRYFVLLWRDVLEDGDGITSNNCRVYNNNLSCHEVITGYILCDLCCTLRLLIYCNYKPINNIK